MHSLDIIQDSEMDLMKYEGKQVRYTNIMVIIFVVSGTECFSEVETCWYTATADHNIRFFCLDSVNTGSIGTWPRGYKTYFMLNSAEHEIFSANKYENANNSWHFHIY